jgi:hypothetical protein
MFAYAPLATWPKKMRASLRSPLIWVIFARTRPGGRADQWRQ